MKRFDEALFNEIAQGAKTKDDQWLMAASDCVRFLKQNATTEEIAIYASAECALIQGVLAISSKVSPADQSDLLRAHIQMDDTWCIQRAWGGGQGHRMYLEPPLSSPGCETLVGGEMLIYRRSFHGVDDFPWSVELSQKLIHSLNVFFVEERSAYCRLDRRGDLEDVIRIIKLPAEGSNATPIVVTILIKDLAEYMALSDTALVLKFDFTRFNPDNFGGWANATRQNKSTPDLFYNEGWGANASYINGCMILRPAVTVEDLIQAWQDEDDPAKKEYATFKIIDWKNDRQIETSCGPEFLSNYFQQSDKPYELSPTFFRPEVLHRFKADPEKYDLQDRTIGCRNAWYLTTYDINEAGQVHTYIGYLAGLPFEEQLYWQSFNEWPKGPISKRAYENDFLGEFSTDYDALRSIKQKISALDRHVPDWWNPRGQELADTVRYPATDSVSEWADEILALDQLLVEGFLVKPLRKRASDAGRTIDPQWKSLRLLQECLEVKGHTGEEAKSTLTPLMRLHGLRNPLKGHGSTEERKEEQKKARTEHGTLRAHFAALAKQCDDTLKSVGDCLGFQFDTE